MYICKEVSDDFFQNASVVLERATTTEDSLILSPIPLPQDAEYFEWTTPSVIKAMIFTAITLCTISGNAMVLLSMILRRNTLKSSTHYFIASLSLADFLVGVLVMPFLGVLSTTGKWYFGRGYCVAFHCIHYWLCSASILSITAICLERYIGVRYPLQHFKFMNIQKVMQTCGVVWFLAGLLSVPPLFIWPEPFPDEPYTCPVNFQVGHVVTVMVFMFYIPCTIMLGFYWQIYSIATEHLQAISNRRQKTHGAVTSSGDSGNGNRSKKKEMSSSGGSTNMTNTNSSSQDYNSSDSYEIVDGKKMKVVSAGADNSALVTNRQKQTSLSKKLAFVVGAFIVCYFPFFTTFMVMAIKIELVPVQLFIALGWVRYFNCCLNPMIYAAMLKPFRNAFNDIFKIITCRN